MKYPPLVSIIIPAFNAQKTIGQTLDSAVNQTWKNKEIIVINDCSNDDTLNVVKNYELLGVRVLNQPERRRTGSARNRGFIESQGDYIQYLDADDVMSTNKIETQINRLFNYGSNSSIATCQWVLIYNNLKKMILKNDILWKDQNNIDFLYNMFRYGLMTPLMSYLIPRHLAEKAGRWDESLLMVEDPEYMCRVCLVSKNILFCGDATVYYRKNHDGQSVSQTNKDKISSWINSLVKIENNILSKINTLKMKDAISVNYQTFSHNVYPKYLPYIRIAEQKAISLSNVKFRYKGSKFFAVLSLLFGWKFTKRFELFIVNNGLGRSNLKKILGL